MWSCTWHPQQRGATAHWHGTQSLCASADLAIRNAGAEAMSPASVRRRSSGMGRAGRATHFGAHPDEDGVHRGQRHALRGHARTHLRPTTRHSRSRCAAVALKRCGSRRPEQPWVCPWSSCAMMQRTALQAGKQLHASRKLRDGLQAAAAPPGPSVSQGRSAAAACFSLLHRTHAAEWRQRKAHGDHERPSLLCQPSLQAMPLLAAANVSRRPGRGPRCLPAGPRTCHAMRPLSFSANVAAPSLLAQHPQPCWQGL